MGRSGSWTPDEDGRERGEGCGGSTVGAGFAGMGRGSSQGGQRSVGSVAGFHSSRPGAGNVFAWALTTKMLTSQRRVGDHRAGELRPSATEIVRGGEDYSAGTPSDIR